MPDINSIIDSLSDEELDLLNNDPELLAQFKAKYQAPTPAAPAPAQPMPEEKGVFGKTMDVLGTPGRGVGALAYGAGQATVGNLNQNTLQTMAEMTKPGFVPQDAAQRGADIAGTLTNLAVPVGEAATLAAKGAKALNLGPKIAAIGKGLVSTTKGAGEGIAAAEKAANIATDAVVTIPKGGRGLTKALEDIKDTGDLVKQGLKQETPEFLQALKDKYDQASGILDLGKQSIGKKNYALASKAKAAINEALNSMVPGRSNAQLAARTAYVRNNLAKAGVITGITGYGIDKVKGILSGALGGNQ